MYHRATNTLQVQSQQKMNFGFLIFPFITSVFSYVILRKQKKGEKIFWTTLASLVVINLIHFGIANQIEPNEWDSFTPLQIWFLIMCHEFFFFTFFSIARRIHLQKKADKK